LLNMPPPKISFLSRRPWRASRTAKPAQAACIHCGLPAGGAPDLSVRLDGASHPVCCRACQAIADALIACGQSAYYRERASQQHDA
jgi:Cu2+-exporting ATPase